MGFLNGIFGSTKKAPPRDPNRPPAGTASTSLKNYFTRSGRNKRLIRSTAVKAAAAGNLAAAARTAATSAQAQVEKAKAAEKEYTEKGCAQLDKDRHSANLSTIQKLQQVRSLGVGALFKQGVTTGTLANAQLKAAMAKQKQTALVARQAAANAKARSDAALEAKRQALKAAEENATATSAAATAAENVVRKLPNAPAPSNIPKKNGSPPTPPPAAPPPAAAPAEENPAAAPRRSTRRSRRSSRRNRH